MLSEGFLLKSEVYKYRRLLADMKDFFAGKDEVLGILAEVRVKEMEPNPDLGASDVAKEPTKQLAIPNAFRHLDDLAEEVISKSWQTMKV